MDESALLRALESGRLAGAALDVMAGEQEQGFSETLQHRPLVTYARTHDGLILTPHYAGATHDAWILTEARAVELLLETLQTPGARLVSDHFIRL